MHKQGFNQTRFSVTPEIQIIVITGMAIQSPPTTINQINKHHKPHSGERLKIQE